MWMDFVNFKAECYLTCHNYSYHSLQDLPCKHLHDHSNDIAQPISLYDMQIFVIAPPKRARQMQLRTVQYVLLRHKVDSCIVQCHS